MSTGTDTQRVEFYSGGCRLVGILRVPAPPHQAPFPVLVQGPGWLGLASSPTSDLYKESFLQAGYAFFTFDYRGFGESEGERGWVRPEQQVEDLLNALSYLTTRDDIDAERLGLFGLGGTGGGNAIYAAAMDPRVKCVIVQTVVADGPDWLHRMRREYEWVQFVDRVEANRRRRLLTGEDELVDPREELMVATPERKADASRSFNDSRIGELFHLSSAESLMRYRPIDVVHQISPRALLLTCIAKDVVTPEDHARALYEKAGTPKKLIRQVGVNHYEAYRKNHPQLMPHFLDWCARYLVDAPVPVTAAGPAEETVLIRPRRDGEQS